MIRSLRTSSPAALLAMLCAPLVAWGESPDSSVRMLTKDELYVSEGIIGDDEPSQVTLEIEPVDAEMPLPPNVGGELGDPAPNPYEATEPVPPPEMSGDLHGFQEHPSHLPLAHYLRHRPPQPQMQRESWLNRPYSLGILFGGMFLDDPTSSAEGDAGVMYGLRFGWDFAPRWGIETRIAGSRPGISDPNGVWDLPAAKVWMWDANWLWYWTGDTRWRPYASVGLGVFDADYDTPGFNHQHNTTFGLPFGVGLKYRHSTRFAMRFDLTDNVSFASGMQDALHSISLTAGLEARFGGGYRRNYWPWNPGHDWR